MELHNRIIKKGGNLLEFGAGTGFLAEIFRTKFNLNPDCIELDPNLVKLIKNKDFSLISSEDKSCDPFSQDF
jgi:16S rRNA A1518/A1519 N6-dimethyltransferase RsmA/KsgA/DIM1 with predicted DNA glycosylase/AP lyase activity